MVLDKTPGLTVLLLSGERWRKQGPASQGLAVDSLALGSVPIQQLHSFYVQLSLQLQPLLVLGFLLGFKLVSDEEQELIGIWPRTTNGVKCLLATSLVVVAISQRSCLAPRLNRDIDSSFELLVELNIENVSDLALNDVSPQELLVLLVLAVLRDCLPPYKETS